VSPHSSSLMRLNRSSHSYNTCTYCLDNDTHRTNDSEFELNIYDQTKNLKQRKAKTRRRTMNGSLRTRAGFTLSGPYFFWKKLATFFRHHRPWVFKQCLPLVTWQTSTLQSSEYLTEAHRCSEMPWRILQTLVFYLTWVLTCMFLRP